MNFLQVKAENIKINYTILIILLCAIFISVIVFLKAIIPYFIDNYCISSGGS